MQIQTRRVVIFPSDVGFEIRYNIVRWRKYLCQRLEAAGIEFICPVGAHEPLPTGNYRWSRFHDGTLTIEQEDTPCPELFTPKPSENSGNRLQHTEAPTDLIAASKPQSKWSKPKKKQSKKSAKRGR